MTSPDVNIIFAEEPININLGEDPVEIEMPAGQNGQSLRPRGAWSSSEEYGYLDLVSYQGSSYVATKTVPTGTLPTDTGFWMLSAEKGLDGASEWGDITGDIANQTDLAQALAGKANVGDSYTKAETDTLLADKADADNVYSKSETDSLLADKADTDDVYTKTETDALLLDKAPVILSSASGSIASFTDGSPALPVEDLTVAIEPVQDLHGYDNPWPAGGGKNLYNPDEAETNRWIEPATGNTQNTTGYWVSGWIPVVAGESYTKTTVGSSRAAWYDASKGYVSGETWNGGTKTVPENVAYCRFTGQTATIAYDGQVQFEKGSSASSWTPYSNICPISGHDTATVTRTGKNILPSTIYNYAVSNNKIVQDANYRSMYCKVISGKTYTVSRNTISGNRFRLIGTTVEPANGVSATTFVSADTTGTLSETITIPDGYNYLLIYLSNQGDTITSNIQVELGSTATSYEPYQPIQTVTISLDGTRYGGTLDVITGQMTVTTATKVYDGTGSNTLSYKGSSTAVDQYYRALTAKVFTPNSRFLSDNEIKENKIKANLCPVISSTIGNTDIIAHMVYIGSNGAYQPRINFPLSMGIDTVEKCTAWLVEQAEAGHPFTITYPIATPLTVQLTPSQLSTLLGENHIWADTGDVDLTYRADTKLFIQEQIAESETLTRKMIADSATADGKAPKSLATGDLIIVGDELRKATANIGNGSAITASNSTTATLADVIKALQ